jgi:hypothetical protein
MVALSTRSQATSFWVRYDALTLLVLVRGPLVISATGPATVEAENQSNTPSRANAGAARLLANRATGVIEIRYLPPMSLIDAHGRPVNSNHIQFSTTPPRQPPRPIAVLRCYAAEHNDSRLITMTEVSVQPFDHSSLALAPEAPSTARCREDAEHCTAWAKNPSTAKQIPPRSFTKDWPMSHFTAHPLQGYRHTKPRPPGF